MNLDAQINASKAARAFIEQASALAKGWLASAIGFDGIPGERLYAYCADFSSGLAWMAAVSYEGFRSRSTEVRESGEDRSEIFNNLDACIELLIACHSMTTALNGTDNTASGDGLLGLEGFLTAYAGTTQIAFDEKVMQPSGHFIVVRYGNEFGGSIFRPMLVPPYLNNSDGVLSRDQFSEIVAMMVNRDQNSNPEWFE